MLGLRRPGLRRPVGAGRVGDGRRRRHRRSRRRGGRGRAAAGPPSVAAAWRRHGGRGHGEGGAAARAHPPRSALFTAHTNADAASPGVSDALAAALGLTVEGVLAPAVEPSRLDKWVIFVPAESAEAVRAAVFGAGAGHIGDYSHCSWTGSGTGQFMPLDGASPTIGSVGAMERVAEERIEMVAPAQLARRGADRDARRAPLRGTRVRRVRARAVAIRRRDRPRMCPAGSRNRCRPSSRGSRPGSRRRPGACGRRGTPMRWCRGWQCVAVRATRCSTQVATAGVQAYLTADLRHHPADEHRRRSRRRPGRRRALGQRVAVVRAGRRSVDRPLRWSTQVRVSSPVRTDPWNVGRRSMKAEADATTFADRADRDRRRARSPRAPRQTPRRAGSAGRRHGRAPHGERRLGRGEHRVGGHRRAR